MALAWGFQGTRGEAALDRLRDQLVGTGVTDGRGQRGAIGFTPGGAFDRSLITELAKARVAAGFGCSHP